MLPTPDPFSLLMLGGHCLNLGCITSKAIIHSATLANQVKLDAASSLRKTLSSLMDAPFISKGPSWRRFFGRDMNQRFEA
jgi:hypothetical protein